MNNRLTWIVLCGVVLSSILAFVGVTVIQSSNNEPLPSADTAYAINLTQLCRTCHGADLAGGNRPYPGSPSAPNLTPGGELAGWTEADFITVMVSGYKPNGQRLSDHMPWQSLTAYGDLGANARLIWQYLNTLPSRPTN